MFESEPIEKVRFGAIVKGVPVPPEAKGFGMNKRNQALYPWPEMAVGDMWECDLPDSALRNCILVSLRSFMKNNPEKAFSYQLTSDPHSHSRRATGIEIWRTT